LWEDPLSFFKRVPQHNLDEKKRGGKKKESYTTRPKSPRRNKNKRKNAKKQRDTPSVALERLAKRTFRELARARIDDRIRSANYREF